MTKAQKYFEFKVTKKVLGCNATEALKAMRAWSKEEYEFF